MTEKKLPDVCMVGLGYIGLPTAAVIAQAGCHVLGVDINPSVVETINNGGIHIEERDLDVLVLDMVKSGRLRAATAPQPSDVFLIAVPTPFKGDHEPDISYVLSAAEMIAPVLRSGNLVVLESTSPIGTTERLCALLARLRPDLSIAGQNKGSSCDVHVAYCPERVLPGKIIEELVSNDRSIGGIGPCCAEAGRDFYRIFVQGECVETIAATAEMVKLVENASRDVSIAFANELSLIADRMGIDVWEVITLANRHPRVNILQPGPGVGGHCIAVDPWFLVDAAPDVTPLIATARRVNDSKPHYVVDQAQALIDNRPDARIACLGLAFKANIDDFRESPALEVALEIARRHGERVNLVEPHARELPVEFEGTGARMTSLDEALERCDVLVVLVDHEEFKRVQPTRRAGKLVLDTRGIWRD